VTRLNKRTVQAAERRKKCGLAREETESLWGKGEPLDPAKLGRIHNRNREQSEGTNQMSTATIEDGPDWQGGEKDGEEKKWTGTSKRGWKFLANK